MPLDKIFFQPGSKPCMHHILQFIFIGNTAASSSSFDGVQRNHILMGQGEDFTLDVQGFKSASPGVFEQCGQQYGDEQHHAATQHLVIFILSVHTILLALLVTQHFTVTCTVCHHIMFPIML
jgi:hypothetical protein